MHVTAASRAHSFHRPQMKLTVALLVGAGILSSASVWAQDA